jgi:predicted kinase
LSAEPLLYVVTGPPASGKTSVAEELAKALGVPFLSKDMFKEKLYESFGSGDELEAQINSAALAILFSVVESQLAEGVSVTAESNFDARSDVEPIRRLADEHDVRIVQIHIGGAIDALVEKFARRAASGKRHPGHGDEPGDADELRAKLEAGLWEPLELPGTRVKADMHEDEEEIVDRVREALGR